MVVGKDNVIAWFKSNGGRYWTVKQNSATQTYIAQSEREHNTAQVDSLKKLSDFCDMVGNQGQYYITIQVDKDKPSAGNFSTLFRLEPASANVNASTMPVVSSGLTIEQVETLTEKKLVERMEVFYKDQKIKDLEAQVKEMEPNQVNEAISTVIKETKPYWHDIFKSMGFTPKFNKVPAIGHVEVETQYKDVTDEIIVKPSVVKNPSSTPGQTKDMTEINTSVDNPTEVIGIAVQKIVNGCAAVGEDPAKVMEMLGNAIEEKPLLIKKVIAFLE